MRSSIIIPQVLLLLGTTLLLPVDELSAQDESASPLSRNGLGDLSPRNYSRNFAMGGVGVSLPGYKGVDPSNPGHYGNLREPTFEMGVTHQRIRLLQGGEEERRGNTVLQNIAFGFPASDRWTLVMGIQPYSQRSYSMRDTLFEEGAGEYVQNYQGSGRFQKVFLGNGYNLIQRGDSLVLGVGLQLNYLFGSLTDQRSTQYQSSGHFHTSVENEWRVGEFLLDGGMHFQKRFDLHVRPGTEGKEMVPLKLMAGVTAQLPRSTELAHDELGVTYDATGSTKDTTSYINSRESAFQFPLGYGGGIAFEYDERLRLALEFDKKEWGSADSEAASLLFRGGQRDRMAGRAGLEFTPQAEHEPSASYFSYWDYRVGGRYIQEYYSYKGEQVRDLGISFGFGVPLVRSSSQSTIDLGAEWSRRGTGEGAPLLRERAWRFYFGLSLSPHRADQWFQKPKIR